MAILEYPRGISGDDINDENPYRSRIIFGIKKVEPAEFGNIAQDKASGESFRDQVGGALDYLYDQTIGRVTATAEDNRETEEKQKGFIDKSVQQFKQSGGKRFKFMTNKIGEIALYTPAGIQLDDRLDYNTASPIGFGGNALLNTVDQGLSSGIRSAVGAAAVGVSDFADIVTGNEAGRIAAVRASQGLIGRNVVPDKIQNAVSLAAQVTINPNLRTLFKGVQVRTFGLNFQFIPNDASEAASAENIIKKFRYHSYPSTKGLGAYGFNFPERFSIKIETYNDTTGQWETTSPIFLDSYLTSVSVTSNPSASVYHDDGQAVQTNLTLAFAEHRTLTREDINPPQPTSSKKVSGSGVEATVGGFGFGNGVGGSGGNGTGDQDINQGIVVEVILDGD